MENEGAGSDLNPAPMCFTPPGLCGTPGPMANAPTMLATVIAWDK